MAQGRGHPQPGDLIEIFRPLYEHWAIYVGEGYVIHVTDDGGTSFNSVSSSSATRAMVKKELLTKVVKNHKWRVNNKYDDSRTPFPIEQIIQSAEEWVGEEVPYSVITRNCEHFVTELRYGKARSAQVKEAAKDGLLAGAVGFVAGLIALIGTALVKK